jgi:hypothetical protein
MSIFERFKDQELIQTPQKSFFRRVIDKVLPKREDLTSTELARNLNIDIPFTGGRVASLGTEKPGQTFYDESGKKLAGTPESKVIQSAANLAAYFAPGFGAVKQAELMTQGALKIHNELKTMGETKTTEWSPTLSYLMGGKETYDNVNKRIENYLDEGRGVLASYIGATSESLLDVGVTGAIMARGFSVLSKTLAKGDDVAVLEAWKTLGSPKTKEELVKNYNQLTSQFYPKLQGADDASFKIINKANTLLNEKGLDTTIGLTKTKALDYINVIKRQTKVGDPVWKLDLDKVQPTERLGFTELPGTRPIGGQAPRVGLQTEAVVPVTGKESPTRTTPKYVALKKLTSPLVPAAKLVEHVPKAVEFVSSGTLTDLKRPTGYYNLRRAAAELDGRTPKQIAKEGIGPMMQVWNDTTKSLVAQGRWKTDLDLQVGGILSNNKISVRSSSDMQKLTAAAEGNLKMPEKFQKAASEVRKIYDGLYTEINKARVARGDAPMNYRQDYITHMKEAQDEGINVFGSTEFKFAKARMGELDKRELSFNKLFEGYINAAAKEIFIKPVISSLDALQKTAADQGLQRLNNTLANIRDVAFRGDVGALDQAFGLERGTLKRKIVSEVTRARTTAALTGNPQWVVAVQPLSLAMIAPQVGGLARGNYNLNRGWMDWLTNSKIRQRVKNLPSYQLKAESGKIGSTGAGDVAAARASLTATKRDRLNEFLSIPANIMEEQLAGIAGAAGLRYAEQLGMKPDDADIFASYIIESTQSAYNKESLANLQQNAAFKLVAPFKTFAFEASALLNNLAGKGGGIPFEKGQKANAFLSWVLGTMVGVWWAKKTTGRNMAWIKSNFPVTGDIGGAVYQYARSRYKRDVSSQLAMGSPITVQNELEQLIRGGFDAYQNGNFDKLRKLATSWGMGYFGVGGSRIVNTIIDATIANQLGYQRTSSGKKAFELEGSDKIKAYLVGPYGTTAGQEYLDKLNNKIPSQPTTRRRF